MPFGAMPLTHGGVRFRLWAPAARQVDLQLLGTGASAPATLPMVPEAEGWFGLTTELAAAGSRYQFRIDTGALVPDPATRFQPEDVHGPSEVIAAGDWGWQDGGWHGRPWQESVIYELHVGSFTPQGTFAGVQQRLEHLVRLGVSAIELMPVADFPGARNWGYDGTCLFAPDSRYGRPEELKALIDAAHGHGLMVFLDVVYNHFGPEGNYLHHYAPRFFTDRHHTPWGAAINYDGARSHWVREFFIHNALYWLEEYHFDGLRLDAVHAILDDSQPHILTELAQRVRQQFQDRRHIHLMLENDHNAAHYLERDNQDQPRWYVAQWNDDIHHALHVLLTGESGGYYADYADDPVRHLGRCLGEGFAYQGEHSAYRDNRVRGEPSAQLPATAFVSFLQNHDQVGNRACGERIITLTQPERLRAALALLLLAPAPPLLFMGEEWGCTQPFPFFCDFGPELAPGVAEGRRQEFARFPRFSDEAARQAIPDPMDAHTFARAVLDWDRMDLPPQRHWLALYRELLALRRRELIPRLGRLAGRDQGCTRLGPHTLAAHWVLGDDSTLALLANLGDRPCTTRMPDTETLLYSTHAPGQLPAWSVAWYLHSPGTPA